MKAHNEQMLRGGKKRLYSSVVIDGICITCDMPIKSHRAAIRKIARTFNDLDKARKLLVDCEQYLLVMPPSVWGKRLSGLIRNLQAFARRVNEQ